MKNRFASLYVTALLTAFVVAAIVAIQSENASAQTAVPCYPLRGHTTPALTNNVANAGVIYFGVKTASSPAKSIWNPDAAPIIYLSSAETVCGELTVDAAGKTIKVTLKGKAWNDNWGLLDFTGVFIDGSGIWHGTAKSIPIEQTGSLWLHYGNEVSETKVAPSSAYFVQSDITGVESNGYVWTSPSAFTGKLSSIGLFDFRGVAVPWDKNKLQPVCDPATTDCDGDDDGTPPPTDPTDCEPFDASIHVGASEICADGVDNNCDGAADSADSMCTAPTDLDGDLHVPDVTVPNYDCKDDDASVNSGTDEICTDEKDNDCDGKIDAADSECVTPPEDLTPDPTSDDFDFLPPVIRGGGASSSGTAKSGLKIGYTGIGGGNRAAMRETMVRNVAALKREKGEPAACPSTVRDISKEGAFSAEGIYICKGDFYTKQTGPNSWSDNKTIIVENGNIFIVPEGLGDDFYTFGLFPTVNDKNSQLGIIVLRTDSNLSKGNVYVSGNTRYMRTNIYADGSVYSLDTTSCNKTNDCSNVIDSNGIPILKRNNYSAQDSGFSDLSFGPLQQQLVIEGTVSSNNVLGGSDKNDPVSTRADFTYLRSTYCPRPATIVGFSKEFPGLPCVIEPALLGQMNLFDSTYVNNYTTWWDNQTGDTEIQLDAIALNWSEWIKNRAAPKGIIEEKLRNPGVYFIYRPAAQDLPIFSGSGKSGTTQKRF